MTQMRACCARTDAWAVSISMLSTVTFTKPVRRVIAALSWLALWAGSATAAPTSVEYPPASRASIGTDGEFSDAPVDVQPPVSRLPAVGPELASPHVAPRPTAGNITPEGEPTLAEPLSEDSPPPGTPETAPAELPEPIATRQTVFSIPFKVDPPRNPAATPVEIQLQVSGDEGRTWQLVSKVKPDRGNFVFKAPHDGQYWFGIQTVDRQGKLHPAAPLVPELRVVVDTLSPRLDLSVTRGRAGEIIVEWQALDPGLKHESLTIEYQVGAGELWEPLAIDPWAGHTQRISLSGRAAWWPKAATGEVSARARVSDLAGNQTVKQVKVKPADPPPIDHLATRPAIERPPVGGAVADQNTARGQVAPPAVPQKNASPPQKPVASAQPRVVQQPGVAQQQPAKPVAPPAAAPTQFAPGDPFARRTPAPPIEASSQNAALPQNPVAWPADRSSGPLNADRATNNPAYPPAGVAAGTPSPSVGNTATNNQLDPDWRSSGTTRRTPGTPAQPVSSGAAARPDAGRFDLAQVPPGERPSMVNTRTFQLEYEVDSVGSSGIAKVELWGTRDGGRSWASYAVDNDNRSPLAVMVDGEGVYGFRIVVESGTGLGGLPPRPGDVPEVWAAVDLTQPVAKITSADLGRDMGDIVIRWQASDALLERRPISLFYSDRPGGPWTPIASGLDNTGSYSWRLDNRVPDRVYLRVEARDEAGNIGGYDTAEPLALDRQRPQGRIRGVHSK